ncbi:2-oxo acid dehydrogenase subunit E2 [Marinilongibacter aquaticus]|uniref:dihydrolipoamide acetyltransferase family protein n=1 Tax=Marinilongibacter aquaticus TaxID=2975157 RepID=UPI0021BD2CC7|nr:dihydrolipoamide acetyltransferase family protein [Marinilongibacter aquaticus]UBM59116.1 2-oxo acid dehydrogenase subunit E2 [Marinilongibacter aquaticus]
MAEVKMKMPTMGESIFECTVLNWLVKEGDAVQADDMILEVATDKIDTEIGSSHSGKIVKFLVQPGDVAAIGSPICIIESEEADSAAEEEVIKELEKSMEQVSETVQSPVSQNGKGRFYSPLVLSIAKEEGIDQEELDSLPGSGKDNRLTKEDILAYVKSGRKQKVFRFQAEEFNAGEDTIIEMDRLRMMISDRMVNSKRISPHVASFVETDMTNIVNWRNRIKDDFFEKHNEKITFTPILIEAVAKAIKAFPMINIQVEVPKIIKKGDINIGMAVALEDGNLIVPVIHHADQYPLPELAKKVNDLAKRARSNQLKPDELMGGTYTISNIGTFGNIAGTPIIMQPQVAIMAFGSIRKKPAVIETPQGDLIGVRSQMIISHSYDHRVVDGSLGGLFVKAVSDNLENFDIDRAI